MKGKIFFLRTAIILSMAMVCISCSKSVRKVELDHTTLTLTVGSSQVLMASISPDRAIDKTVIWTSSNPAVATVVNGFVKAESEGTATITVTTLDGNKTTTCLVTVILDLTTNKQMRLSFIYPDNEEFKFAGTDSITIDWGDESPVEKYVLSATPISCNHKYPDGYGYVATISGKNISYMYCKGSKITEMDISGNTALKELYCIRNVFLNNLDVSKNTALTKLYCSNSGLTSLDVSKNTALKELYCSRTETTSLDVSKNTKLKELGCYGNRISNLDVSKCTELEILECGETRISELNVSSNKKLKILSIGDNGNLNTTTLLQSLHSNTISGGKSFYIGWGDYGPDSPKWDMARDKGWTVMEGFYSITF